MDLITTFQEIWAIRALAASSMVGIMCGALGAFIVLRNMSLIGDALSHAILPGIVVAFVLFHYSPLAFFAGATIAGVVSAIGITWIQQVVKTKNDAAIGIVFTAMFSLGVIGISALSKNEGVHLDLKDFLFGNVLTVSDQDLMLTASVTLFVLMSIAVFYRHLFLSTFQEVIAQTMGISVKFVHYFLMLLLSFAVVASLRTVGVILVVAMLITPASTALLLSDKLRNVVLLSSFIGLLASVSGFVVSIVWQTTPGPAMAVMATLIYLVAAIFAPGKGVLAKWLSKRSQQFKVEAEDLVKLGYKLELSGALSTDNLADATGIRGGRLQRHLRRLSDQGLISRQHNTLHLSPAGSKLANKLIRAHRLWETYLVNQVGLGAGQIHEDAEVYEHVLTEEMLDDMDRELGYPKEDPHGSPIPPKPGGGHSSIADMLPNATTTILADQPNLHVTQKLWQLGIAPSSQITLLARENGTFVIEAEGHRIELVETDASQILVGKINYSS